VEAIEADCSTGHYFNPRGEGEMQAFKYALYGATLAALVGWSVGLRAPPLFAQQPDEPLPQAPPEQPGEQQPRELGQPMNEQQQDERVEVLGRGPIHEAFAEPYQGDPAPSKVVDKAPPKAVRELPPAEQPEGNNVEWIPGYWMWDDDKSDYIWISGVWRDVPPAQRWVAGYWTEGEGGFVWVSGFWADETADQLEYLPAPPESLEQGPNVDSPGDDYFWSPGCWRYQDNDYVWQAGYWAPVQQDWVWCAPYYSWTPSGCVFVDGYWDYRLPYRGELFAPVYFHDDYYAQDDYYYTPYVSCNLSPLLIHLFVGGGFHHYCYGDYYGYDNFYPWYSYYGGYDHWDPLFSYYNWHYRHRGFGLAAVIGGWHNHFRDHRDLRPPRTFVQNNTFINKNKNVNKSFVQNAVLTRDFKDVVNKREKSQFNFRKISDDQRQAFRRHGDQIRDLGQARVKAEAKGRADARARLDRKEK